MNIIQAEIIANWEQNLEMIEQRKSELSKYRMQLVKAKHHLLDHVFSIRKGDILTDDSGKTWKFTKIGKWTSHDKTPELMGFELAENGLEISGKLKLIGKGWEK